MNRIYQYIQNKITNRISLLVGLLAILVGVVQASAFDASTYATSSRLASGNWVKVSVTSTGMHFISEATLRSWGFADPSKALVFGYGGQRISDQLNKQTYIDDLPQTPSEYVKGQGIYFYALGPTSWVQSTNGYFRPAQNPFSLEGYYFISDTGEDRVTAETYTSHSSGDDEDEDENEEPEMTDAPATYFYDRLFHEVDLFSPGEAGFLLVGEDFRFTESRQFTFSLPNLVEDEELPVRMEASFVCKSLTARTSVEYSVNGKTLSKTSSDNIAITTDKYAHGVEAISRKEFSVKGNTAVIGVTHVSSTSVVAANLNYIAINYPRALALPSSKELIFYLDGSKTGVSLSGVSKNTRVWDVTNSLKVYAMSARLDGTKMVFEVPFGGARDYVAWEPGGTFQTPTFVGSVGTQDLHSLPTPDMVIFTPVDWKDQAERLAEFHRNDQNDPLQVLVLTPDEVYNEFSSGTPDVQAFRKLLKMFYDRGRNATESDSDAEVTEDEATNGTLRYALFFSRPTYDFRRLTSRVQSMNYPMLPAWFTDRGLNDNDSYTTDDIFGFLEDNSGVNMGRDQLSIAVGRIPSTSVIDAKNAVDKIFNYVNQAPKGIWKNNVLIVADDQDNAVHMTQAEAMWENMRQSEGGADAFFNKLYLDEFQLISGQYPEARSNFYRYLDEGIMWWTYQGHANPSSLTSEGLVTYTDLNNLFLRHWPVVYAATCDFLRWDSYVISGAEILFNNPNGGVIGAISATRPVYISDNGYLSESFGNYIFSRDEKGRFVPLGEIYRQAKNHYRYDGSVVSNTNKLRYVLMGDPAMRLTMPSHRVVLDYVDEQPVTAIDGPEDPVVIKGRQRVALKGHVEDAFGNKLEDYNGLVSVTLYDAEKSITTRGNGDDGEQITFDQQGSRLLVANDSIKNGVFTLNVVMPAEVADNYRPAALNMFAQGSGPEAIGVCRDLYVYGIDEEAEADNVAPWISSIYLNHPSFENGQKVNTEPMLIATIHDDLAINLSTAGIGHQMTLSLDDGVKIFNNVSDFFTPFSDGTPGGNIYYPLENIDYGYHTLRLRIWDTGPNSAEAKIEFMVAKNAVPIIYDVYTDANPASTSANFFVTHDRPDRNLSVTIEVFNLMGQRIWTTTQKGRSDMFTSSPIAWDLTDMAGRRINRGIYLYRATISDEESGEKTATASRKLAVKAQP